MTWTGGGDRRISASWRPERRARPRSPGRRQPEELRVAAAREEGEAEEPEEALDRGGSGFGEAETEAGGQKGEEDGRKRPERRRACGRGRQDGATRRPGESCRRRTESRRRCGRRILVAVAALPTRNKCQDMGVEQQMN